MKIIKNLIHHSLTHSLYYLLVLVVLLGCSNGTNAPPLNQVKDTSTAIFYDTNMSNGRIDSIRAYQKEFIYLVSGTDTINTDTNRILLNLILRIDYRGTVERRDTGSIIYDTSKTESRIDSIRSYRHEFTYTVNERDTVVDRVITGIFRDTIERDTNLILFSLVKRIVYRDSLIEKDTAIIIDTTRNSNVIDSIINYKQVITYTINERDTIENNARIIFRDTINRDTSKVKQGLTTVYNSDGSIIYTVHYQNDSLHGTRIGYIGNRIWTFDCYQNGNQRDDLLPTCRGFDTGIGTDTIRSLNDTIYLIYAYQNGRLHGLYTLYRSDSSIFNLDCYQNGQETNLLICRGFDTGSGTDTIRDLRNSIYLIYAYQNGQLHGLYTRYWNNDSVSQIGNYQNGQLHGLLTDYRTDGSTFQTKNYQNGQLHGLWTKYNSDGSTSQTSNYQNGQLHGLYTWYNSDGTIRSLVCYQDGRDIKRAIHNFNSFTCP